MLKEWIAVAVGGMLGALARHAIYWLMSLMGPAWLPLATLLVNVLGCFLIGMLVQWSFQAGITTSWYVVGMRVGFFGGLTTFSAFSLDLVRLWYEDRTLGSLMLAASHLVLGFIAVVVGMALVESRACSRVSQIR